MKASSVHFLTNTDQIRCARARSPTLPLRLCPRSRATHGDVGEHLCGVGLKIQVGVCMAAGVWQSRLSPALAKMTITCAASLEMLYIIIEEFIIVSE